MVLSEQASHCFSRHAGDEKGAKGIISIYIIKQLLCIGVFSRDIVAAIVHRSQPDLKLFVLTVERAVCIR